MNIYLLLTIGAGGFLGAISRFGISSIIQKATASSFPLGTLVVNVIGSFIIGFLYLYFQNQLSSSMKLFVTTGFLGALTTFSTFSLETIVLLQDHFYIKAITNLMLNVILSLVATILGIMLYKKLYGI